MERKTQVHAEDGRQEILITREFDLPVDGVMAIPPVDEDMALHAAFLCKIAERNGLKVRSIGMSDDFETAIRFGSTMVRVGSAIFGARPPRN